MSDPNSNPNMPNTVLIQFFRPISRDRDVLKYYKDWDTDKHLRWTIEKGVDISWQSTNAILTAWKSRIRQTEGEHGRGNDPTTKIPEKQIKIITTSLAQLVASESE